VWGGTHLRWSILSQVLLPSSLHALLDLLDSGIEVGFRFEPSVLESSLVGDLLVCEFGILEGFEAGHVGFLFDELQAKKLESDEQAGEREERG